MAVLSRSHTKAGWQGVSLRRCDGLLTSDARRERPEATRVKRLGPIVLVPGGSGGTCTAVELHEGTRLLHGLRH